MTERHEAGELVAKQAFLACCREDPQVQAFGGEPARQQSADGLRAETVQQVLARIERDAQPLLAWEDVQHYFSREGVPPPVRRDAEQLQRAAQKTQYLRTQLLGQAEKEDRFLTAQLGEIDSLNARYQQTAQPAPAQAQPFRDEFGLNDQDKKEIKQQLQEFDSIYNGMKQRNLEYELSPGKNAPPAPGRGLPNAEKINSLKNYEVDYDPLLRKEHLRAKKEKPGPTVPKGPKFLERKKEKTIHQLKFEKMMREKEEEELKQNEQFRVARQKHQLQLAEEHKKAELKVLQELENLKKKQQREQEEVLAKLQSPEVYLKGLQSREAKQKQRELEARQQQ